MQQDEIYLIDLWRIFSRQWRWFAAVLVAVLVLTLVYAHLARPKWEAVAWIQVGQVGSAPQGQDPKVESFQRVLQRLQTLAFQNDVLKSQGIDVKAPDAQLYRRSFKLDPEPYANLIKLSVRALSPQQANQLALATVAQLHAIHQDMEAGPLKLARERLAQIQTELQGAIADRDRMLHTAGQGGKDENTSAIAGILLAGKNEDIHSLQVASNELTNRLSPGYTFETSMPWPIAVSEAPVAPNLTLAWGIGGFLGLFLGALAAMARDAIRRSAASL
jgi:uncharacterized protein involved in exopolysaccharide biosynthesis